MLVLYDDIPPGFPHSARCGDREQHRISLDSSGDIPNGRFTSFVISFAVMFKKALDCFIYSDKI